MRRATLVLASLPVAYALTLLWFYPWGYLLLWQWLIQSPGFDFYAIADAEVYLALGVAFGISFTVASLIWGMVTSSSVAHMKESAHVSATALWLLAVTSLALQPPGSDTPIFYGIPWLLTATFAVVSAATALAYFFILKRGMHAIARHVVQGLATIPLTLLFARPWYGKWEVEAFTIGIIRTAGTSYDTASGMVWFAMLGISFAAACAVVTHLIVSPHRITARAG